MLDTLPVLDDTTTTNDIVHVFCECNPDYALCGTPVMYDKIVQGMEITCVVCNDLICSDCAYCGCPGSL